MTVEEVFADVFAISPGDVNDNLELRNIGNWDSMSHMVLIMRLEEAFQVQLNGDQIADMKTVGDAKSALQAQGASI